MDIQRPPGVAKTAAKYGLIQGVVAFAISTVSTVAAIKPTWAAGLLNTILLIVLMVLAHREFKNTHNGVMTYPEGLGSGTLLSIIAAAVSAVFAYVYFQYINSGALAAVLQAQQAALEHQGLTGAQAQQAMGLIGVVLTPTGIAVSTLISGVIVGFIIALITSIFTQSSTARS